MELLPHDFIFQSNRSFTERCEKVYRYQAERSTVYRSFVESFGLNEKSDLQIEEIPLLPIEAFKHKALTIDELNADLTFMSSGTGSMSRSTHHILDKEVYKKSISKEFYRHFPADQYSVLCHMPGYSNNLHSSLVWMSNHLIESDGSGLSKFLPHNNEEIENHLERIMKANKIPVLFGAAFGILDLIDSGLNNFPESLEVIETGGMKTFRREISKQELRMRISEGFNIPHQQIHSEYGMCELLSQFYAIGSEWFQSPHWVHVTIRKGENPQEICEAGEEGKIGVIDLANLHSCSFVLTEDRGIMGEDGKFKVLGRWNPENLRGCNFMIDS
jgi:hypothetical protein